MCQSLNLSSGDSFITIYVKTAPKITIQIAAVLKYSANFATTPIAKGILKKTGNTISPKTVVKTMQILEDKNFIKRRRGAVMFNPVLIAKGKDEKEHILLEAYNTFNNQKLIKSKERVQKHGEVFTPNWVVNLMLDQVKSQTDNIYATFLEPSAGEGAFLTAILERKLESVKQQFDKKFWKTKSLFALASIYGIELLEDKFGKVKRI